jgi:hypothetical protein
LVRGVTLEALRAFLSSVLVNPDRSRNWLEWIRSWTADRAKSIPEAVAKAESPAAAKASGSAK